MIKEAVRLLRAGEVVAFATETVYGLAVAAENTEAVKKLYRIKGRDAKKPMALLVHSKAQAEKLCGPVPAPVKKLMKKFWPGPLTLVLPSRKDKSKTIGLRLPDHALSLAIARAFKKPILLTSANKSGEKEAKTAREVKAQLGKRVALVLDGGRVKIGKPSTVFAWTAASKGVLREGAISEEKINKVLRSK